MRYQNLNQQQAGFESDPNGGDMHIASNMNHSYYEGSDIPTLEGLRRTFNSCTNCGVCWYVDHVSLDCSECGGYAMRRPCVTCNGKCGSVWHRDAKASHVSKRAEWIGACSLTTQWSSNLIDQTLTHKTNANLNISKVTRESHLL